MLIIREAYFGAKLEMIEAATELSEELRNKGSYIRDGVTLEEVRKAAALLHYQLACGFEDDALLVNVDDILEESPVIPADLCHDILYLGN